MIIHNAESMIKWKTETDKTRTKTFDAILEIYAKIFFKIMFILQRPQEKKRISCHVIKIYNEMQKAIFPARLTLEKKAPAHESEAVRLQSSVQQKKFIQQRKQFCLFLSSSLCVVPFSAKCNWRSPKLVSCCASEGFLCMDDDKGP